VIAAVLYFFVVGNIEIPVINAKSPRAMTRTLVRKLIENAIIYIFIILYHKKIKSLKYVKSNELSIFGVFFSLTRYIGNHRQL
jgi:predicted Kef-type K+ transport protein